jgi:lipoprotein-anchoring transpeptidase ErfK/SrfK
MKKILILLMVISFCNIYSESMDNLKVANKVLNKINQKRKDKIENLIIVDANKQELYLVNNKKIIAEYKISTGYSGTDSNATVNSLKTPIGLHKIVKKIGDSCKIGTIFKGKRNTKKIAKIIVDKKDLNTKMIDYVLTRVLVLEGKEPGINNGRNKEGVIVDSHYRGIYIHGTNNEVQIGEPASHGCIRMKNKDVIDLYNRIKVGCFVYIYK